MSRTTGYRFGRLLLHSEIALTTARTHDGELPLAKAVDDITIMCAEVGHGVNVGDVQWIRDEHLDDGTRYLRIGALNHLPVLDYPGGARFVLDLRRRTMWVTAEKQTPGNHLEHLVLDNALPRMLSMLGELVFHATAVRSPIGTVALMGKSGWGKSTLALACVNHGWPLQADDCLIVEMREGQPWVIPSYPNARLMTDSAERLLGSSSESAWKDSFGLEQGLRFDPEPSPLVLLCVLSEPDTADTEPTLRELTGIERWQSVSRFSLYAEGAVSSAAQRFETLADITEVCRAFELRHPRNYDRLVDVIALLEGRLSEFIAST